ncbi:hypothetical protein JCM10908_005837 [Rhodotorula pacifica]|uniref:uncharacterized protein n=1 Tax=Rhodotorula pacifica TaxID=1495444 RepID=UPI0031816DFA
MASQLRETFRRRRAANEPAFVTFVTAGFPTIETTVPLLLAMERGGADVIELGVPFSDPLADGPAIQHCNSVALSQGVDYAMCLELVQDARAQGLKAPVILMGYYNPFFAYGDERAVQHARMAGANGFIVVDLPPEEGTDFRNACTREGMSYVPLIAPVTSHARIRFLASIADSFVYVVSKMGTTGASDKVASTLTSRLTDIRNLIGDTIPLAVGFGVATQAHFEEVGRNADGVVIGSQLVTVIKNASVAGTAAAVSAAEAYCQQISANRTRQSPFLGTAVQRQALEPAPERAAAAARFGAFGGAYVAEPLVEALRSLAAAYADARGDPTFWEEWHAHAFQSARPTPIYEATRLTKVWGGARIWFKREDLNHHGSLKVYNAIGQVLLARRLGRTRIVTETGSGQHGVATATACAKFGLNCVVYMGEADMERGSLAVMRMRALGATVTAVNAGDKTLAAAANEALRDFVTNLSTSYYVAGSVTGPYPLPTIVRGFHSVVGRKLREQMMSATGLLPDAVVACSGRGSSAMASFHAFVDDEQVSLVAIEPLEAAPLAYGRKGVLRGAMTKILQNRDGQIAPTSSIAAGLDYPAVGPELASLHAMGRVRSMTVSDDQARSAFTLLNELEGVLPSLEAAHAAWGGFQIAQSLSREANVVITICGGGVRDVETLARTKTRATAPVASPVPVSGYSTPRQAVSTERPYSPMVTAGRS